MKKYKTLLTIFITAIMVGAGAFFGGVWYSGARMDEQIKTHNLLAKRIFLSKPADILVNFEPLRSKLRDDLSYYNGNISLYFEYLPTGTSIRLGDGEQLVGASLLKVPAAMELYSLSEQGKVNLDDKITLKKEWLDSNFGTLYKKGAGYTTTIRELAKIMIEQSDNTALNAVQSILNAHSNGKTLSAYDALDVDYTDNARTNLSLSARAYASFLKCLYFACYVSTDSSQEILTYLTHSTYTDEGRLGKYIPDSVAIAHKIGVAGDEVQPDCGIVYIPNRNYLLCVMVGENKERGGEVIAQTSKMVYDYVAGIK